MTETTDRPNCFGDLNKVFPRRSDGLRVTPIECLQGVHKTQCLRTAMGNKQGLTVREEMLERAYRGGMVAFSSAGTKRKPSIV